MKNKLALSTATALGLLMGAAFAADNNVSEIDQGGNNHAAIINQTGDSNAAGSASQPMTQRGFRNSLTILQSGDNNEIGLGTNPIAVEDGVYQNSNRPNVVGNRATINQLSNNNSVGAVSQTSAGTDTNLQTNTLTINQGDAADLANSGGNDINSVTQWRQSSRGNSASLTQSGANNLIDRVSQVSPVAGGGNNANQMTVVMSGDNNGRGALAGAALASGATSSSLIQGDFTSRAARSFINLTISGDTNQFGVTQYGEGNTIGNVVISGNSNQFGVNQNGTGNTLALSTIGGLSNNLGLDQDGNDNFAAVNISGDFNGGGTLAGAAGTLANANNLVSGLIRQDGLRNESNLTITNSNSNQFAFLQDGNDNVIDGDVSGAGSNSATMVQVGNGNLSNFTQSGSGNMVSVNQ